MQQHEWILLNFMLGETRHKSRTYCLTPVICSLRKTQLLESGCLNDRERMLIGKGYQGAF
jgi:hypothetical protein